MNYHYQLKDLTERQRTEELVKIIEKTETIQIGTHEEIEEYYPYGSHVEVPISTLSRIEVPTYRTQFVYSSVERKQARKELRRLKKQSIDNELRRWMSKYFNIEKCDKFYDILDKVVVGPYAILFISLSKIPILSNIVLLPLLLPYTPYILASEGSHRDLKRKKGLLMKDMPK